MVGEWQQRNRWSILFAATALALLLASLVAMKTVVEVVDEGTGFRPFRTDPIYKVRVADELTVYSAKETKPDPDLISGSMLVALATAALLALLVLRATEGNPRLRRFYAFACAGFVLLAVDELFAIHETIGYNLAPLAELPGVERPDDVLFAALTIPALGFIYAFRDVLLSTKRSRWAFGTAFGGAVLAAGFDVASLPGEELLEIVSGTLIVIGFADLLTTHIAACLGRPSDVPPGVSGLSSSASAALGARRPERST